MSRPIIEDIVVVGDSLSDRGAMGARMLMGVIPMELLSGLSSKSPAHRFTNGLVWTDYFASMFAEDSGFKQLNLDDPTRVTTSTGETLVRTFCEGGATSHDYSTRMTMNIVQMGTQQILNTLDVLRGRLFADDDSIGTTKNNKEKTLVVEWSGANDLLTINSDPTIEAAEDAILARVFNIDQMITKSYRHFALMALPDLSLVPRFQAKPIREQNIIRKVVEGFNERLIEEVKKLELKHPECTFLIHDTNPLFKGIFENPAQYQLEEEKRTCSFVDSRDFIDAAPATGYMFWDDVHPTTRVHQVLAKDFYDVVKAKYLLHAPRETLIQIYKEQYGARFEADKSKCGGFFRRSKIAYQEAALTVEGILRHALIEGGDRTRDVLIKLGWIDKQNNLASKNSSISEAFASVKRELENLPVKRCGMC
ncbi:MAG: hypothetical protein A3F13_06405 [Gammaproteobacteria bacterium RIFCSPHIGHO2_12_FULL_40_19]|nr:MAG: hypothetical protein A3F13_06405 [Gammaproteobacteria bacterium RIFCSPHIGHO2_12_FULL_40_19]